MSVIDKFKQISNNLKEYLFFNSIKLNDSDLDSEKTDKLEKRLEFYKQRKDFVEMDKTITMLTENVDFVRYLSFYQQEVVFLAAKTDKKVAYDYMSKYQLEFNRFTLSQIIKDDNLPVLELFMINPEVKFNGNYKDLISPEIIAEGACEKRKIEFLHFACDFPNQDSKFYVGAIKNALRFDYPEGVKFVTTYYKDKLPQEVFGELIKQAVNYGRLPMAEYLKEVSGNNSVNLPNGPIEQKIKQLREENFGKVDTTVVLKK